MAAAFTQTHTHTLACLRRSSKVVHVSRGARGWEPLRLQRAGDGYALLHVSECGPAVRSSLRNVFHPPSAASPGVIRVTIGHVALHHRSEQRDNFRALLSWAPQQPPNGGCDAAAMTAAVTVASMICVWASSRVRWWGKCQCSKTAKLRENERKPGDAGLRQQASRW